MWEFSHSLEKDLVAEGVILYCLCEIKDAKQTGSCEKWDLPQKLGLSVGSDTLSRGKK